MVVSAEQAFQLRVIEPDSRRTTALLFHGLNLLSLIDVLGVVEEDWFQLKHHGNSYMPVGPPSLFFKLLEVPRNNSRGQDIRLNLLIGVFIGVKVSFELFNEAVVVSLLEQIHKQLKDNYISVVSPLFDNLL